MKRGCIVRQDYQAKRSRLFQAAGHLQDNVLENLLVLGLQCVIGFLLRKEKSARRLVPRRVAKYPEIRNPATGIPELLEGIFQHAVHRHIPFLSARKAPLVLS